MQNRKSHPLYSGVTSRFVCSAPQLCLVTPGEMACLPPPVVSCPVIGYPCLPTCESLAGSRASTNPCSHSGHLGVRKSGWVWSTCTARCTTRPAILRSVPIDRRSRLVARLSAAAARLPGEPWTFTEPPCPYAPAGPSTSRAHNGIPNTLLLSPPSPPPSSPFPVSPPPPSSLSAPSSVPSAPPYSPPRLLCD